ncbi:MAG: dienelactone hydrolase family protein [Candidatus Thiodiazotropha sp.]
MYFFDSQAAAEWFFSQPYIDRSRVGAVGLCFGGCLSLMLAARIPLVSLFSV